MPKRTLILSCACAPAAINIEAVMQAPIHPSRCFLIVSSPVHTLPQTGNRVLHVSKETATYPDADAQTCQCRTRWQRRTILRQVATEKAMRQDRPESRKRRSASPSRLPIDHHRARAVHADPARITIGQRRIDVLLDPDNDVENRLAVLVGT